jgi:hypothetical protein
VNTLNIEPIAIIGGLVGVAVIAIIVISLRNDKGYNSKAKDKDGDGIVQEGTRWERPAPTVRVIPAKKKAPVKKTAAKKAAPAKKAPAKKAAPKKK